jgi:hypothetical protein
MEPRQQGLVFIIVGAVLLLAGSVAMANSGEVPERNCFLMFCDSYEGAGAGALGAFGLTGVAVGIVALLWGTVVWFVAPIVLRDG